MGLHLRSIVVLICLLIASSSFALKDADNVVFQEATITLKAGVTTKSVTAEIALSEIQHERGLMFRRSLKKNHGMLFIFKDESIRNFWMKNTIIDLSIGYFNKEKTLIDIQDMKAVTSVLQTEIPNYPSQGPAMYALEMPANWYTQNKIKLGTKLILKNEY